MGLPAAVEPARAAERSRALSYLVVLGMFLAAAWVYRQGFYKALGYPSNTFLFVPGDHFNDLVNFVAPLRANDPLGYVNAVYFPFTYLVMYPLAFLSRTQITVVFTVILIAGLVWYVAAHLDFLSRVDRLGTSFVLAVFTYPFLITFDRGNVEGFVVLLTGGFIAAMETGRRKTAIACLAAAGAMKAVPLVFVALFLVRRDVKAIAWTLGLAAVLMVLGSVFYGFDVPHVVTALRHNLDRYHDLYIVQDNGLPFGCSLFGAIKIMLVDIGGGDVGDVETALGIYAVVAALTGLALAAALLLRRYAFWQQIALLTFATIILPQVSGGYKLLHVLLPAVLFLRYGSEDSRRGLYLAGFALLLVPLPYHVYRPDGTNLSVLVDPLVMLAMTLLILLTPSGQGPAFTAPSPRIRRAAGAGRAGRPG